MTRPDEVQALGAWPTNAAMIADCFTMGWLSDSALTADVTYGGGKFWTVRRPKLLVASDANPAKSPIGVPVDYTALPWPDRFFDDIVFDPPYKLNGTSTGRGPSASDESYGVDRSYRPWKEVHADIRAGIDETVRCLHPGGHLLIKCQDQVSSGRVRWQTREFADHAESLGLRLVDSLILPGGTEQPAGRRQVHARHNYSTLLVCRKPGRRSSAADTARRHGMVDAYVAALGEVEAA